MGLHTIKSIQKIPAGLEEVWEFFSSPANLQTITPSKMKFRVISGNLGPAIFPGQIIEYRVSPVLGIPLYWRTEIGEVDAPHSFVDEQRKGPYRLWRHRHYFKSIQGGVEMVDRVEYENPLGILGEMANGLFIRKKLRNLFEYRFGKIEEIFGAWPEGQVMNMELG